MKRNSLINYTKEAFTLTPNLVYLVGLLVGTVAGIALDLPGSIVGSLAFLGAGLEMLYLGFMPLNKRFIRAINSKRHTQTAQVDQQVRALKYLTQLPKSSLEKYTELYRKKQQISDNLAKNIGTGSSSAFMDSYIAKVNALEAYYVELLFDIDRFTKFLESESSQRLDGQQRQMETEMQGSTGKMQELYRKRLDLIAKRKEKNVSVKEQLQVAQLQIAMLEDTVNYLLEQSITLKNPDDITRAIDQVLFETEEHYQSIRDIQGIVDEFTPEGAFAESRIEAVDNTPSGPRSQQQGIAGA